MEDFKQKNDTIWPTFLQDLFGYYFENITRVMHGQKQKQEY